MMHLGVNIPMRYDVEWMLKMIWGMTLEPIVLKTKSNAMQSLFKLLFYILNHDFCGSILEQLLDKSDC